MRFVPTFCLREGMVLGDNLYGGSGELVLAAETILTPDYIHGIEKLNYNGIYVDDDISRDIHIVNIINERVRAQTLKGIKDVFIITENNNALSKKKFNDMQHQIEFIVEEILRNKNMMVNMIDLKVFDDYTYFHSVNVAVLSIVLGSAMGLGKSELCNLGFGALLHDIGKVFIKKDILNKNGSLTDEEFEEMKRHSALGCDYLKKGFGVLKASQAGIMDHHEKFGGGGYPNNLKGDEISVFGKIIALADVYDALTSERPYRKAVSPSEVMEYVMGSAATLFDPELVKIFMRKIAPYPIGTCVRLSNGLEAIVIENFEDYCLRPKIRVYREGSQEVTPYLISLADHDSLNITVIDVA